MKTRHEQRSAGKVDKDDLDVHFWIKENKSHILTLKKSSSRTGSGLVFVWASELYLSKKEYTLEVLNLGPIIKSALLEGNVIPTYYFLFSIALLNNFRFSTRFEPYLL
jgi:hypothetical protein